MLRLLLLIPVFAPASAQAECPPVFNRVLEAALSWGGTRLSCADVEHVDRLLPLSSSSAGTWGFEGELDLREELRGRYDIYVPADIMPIGFVERRPPAGARGAVIVLGLRMPRRVKVVASLADAPGNSSPGRLAARLGAGARYDRVGFYAGSGGRYTKEGDWMRFRGGVWGARQPIPEAMRLCLPCRGWLCSQEPIVCFSDFDSDKSEEVQLTDPCDEGCRLLIAEPQPDGSTRVLFQGAGSGEWIQDSRGWAFVPRRHTCAHAMAYRLDRAKHALVPDPVLLEAVYPKRQRRVDCWTEEHPGDYNED